MKAIDILEKADKIERTYIMLRKPTKKKYGYAVKLTGDPELLIRKLDTKDNRSTYNIAINGKDYYDKAKFSIPMEIVEKLANAIYKLLDMEI